MVLSTKRCYGGTWFVYLMKPVSQQICVLAFAIGGRCWWQTSLKQGHGINKSHYHNTAGGSAGAPPSLAKLSVLLAHTEVP